jgi:hypothetical protein
MDGNKTDSPRPLEITEGDCSAPRRMGHGMSGDLNRGKRAMKPYGNVILMTLICIVIFWVFMALRPANARDQRAHDVVGKPRIVTRIIPGALMPPPKYDKLYDGELEIRLFSNAADVQQACKNVSDVHSSETGCARFPDDHKRCWLYLAIEDLAKRQGRNYAFLLRHELAHCNGWKHPPTMEGQKFNIGDKWDKAEGGKWLAANTKMPMPTLPALTRILPASPPVVCVAPDWQPESCEDRQTKAFSPKDIWSGGPKDIWSGVRPFQMKDVMR